MSIELCSLNVRGLKNNIKRKAIFLFCKEVRANFILLQETHSSKEDEKFWKQQWGDNTLYSHGTSHSAGVMILFYRFNGKIIDNKSDESGHWLMVVAEVLEFRFILLNIYGYNNRSLNRNMMLKLSQNVREWTVKYGTDNIITGGDFNLAPDSWLDRKPPKGLQPEYNGIIHNFCSSNNLIDYWRVTNPNTMKYTWISPADANLCSRLDYWLLSQGVINLISKCDIQTSPLTDHCLIGLSLSIIKKINKSNNIWKFNNALLLNEEFCEQVKIICHETNNMDLSDISKWEWFKFRVKQQAIETGKKSSFTRKLKQKELVEKISSLCAKSNINTEETEELHKLQNQLDEIYLEKAKGAFVRSKAKWIEQGEKNSSYFYGLEKRRQNKKCITKLYKNGNITQDSVQITEEVNKFYSNLYKTKFQRDKCDTFMSTVKKYVKTLSEEDKLTLEKDLSISEIEIALKQMKNDKSPGIDGLSVEFYKTFWQEIKHLLFDAYLDCINNNQLSPTMKTGLITLLPKPNKDLLQLDNWRPITLLCNDYKLLALVYANRIKGVLNKLIDEFQSAFIKGRHIHNNVRLILDMLDYHTLINSESLILFIDFFKAFDSIEHNFIMQSLRLFGFGNNFCKIIKMFYDQIYSYIALHSGITPRIDVSCGIRQGCPISPKLFILCTQLMAYIIVNNKELEGIKICDTEFKISQFADDTVIFLKDKSILEKALNVISVFSEASGLQLNLKKCEILPLYDCIDKELASIPIKNDIKYLGIHLSKNMEVRESKNVKEKFEEISKILNHWLTRDLTILGRNILSKSEGLSKLVYPSYSLYISQKNIRKANTIIYQFIWRNKTHYIKKSQLVKEYNKGGLKTIDLESIIGVFRVNWIKAFFDKPDSLWFHIPKNILEKVGGLEFLLKCDYDICKLPVKLSNYHKQVLHYWKMVFTHNFTPHGSTLWNNRVITVNRKMLFIQSWFEKGIIFVTDILDEQGNLLEFITFKNKFNIQSSLREYKKICKAIPLALLKLIQNYLQYSREGIRLPKLQLSQISVKDKKCNNKYINKIFKRRLFHDFDRNAKLRHCNDKLTSAYIKFMKWPIPPKIKEMQFKILNGYYPAAAILRKRFRFEVEPCVFCSLEDETMEHLFYFCPVTKVFWQEILNWMKIKMNSITQLDLELVLYGIGKLPKNISKIVNIIIIMGKYHIHKGKWQNKTPSLATFKIEMQSYFLSLSHIKNSRNDVLDLCEDVSTWLIF